MSTLRIKNLNSPDSVLRDARKHADAVEIGDITVYREVDQPGWRWSVHHRDMVGTEWCEARHVGVVISGCFGVLLRDGTTGEIVTNLPADPTVHTRPRHHLIAPTTSRTRPVPAFPRARRPQRKRV